MKRRFTNQFLSQFWSVWFLLAIICILLSFSSDTFFTYANLTNILRQISVNIILASGMTIVIIIGGIDLSVGATLAFSSFIMADLMKDYGIFPAIVTGLAVGAGIGLINGIIVSRRKSMAFVITLGTMTIWRSFTAIYSGGLPISDFPLGFQTIASGYFLFIPIPFWIAILTVFLTLMLLQQTKFGKYVYAIGSNTTAARNCGININLMVMFSFVLCGLFAALAGIVLTSRLDAAQVQGGLGYEMDAIAAVVIGGTSLSGGRGRILGTLAGALLMGVLRNGLNLMNVSSNWQQTVMGIVIIVTILWDKDSSRFKIRNSVIAKGESVNK
jgi:Ribose/xylose/arabinose/galactoside ABC-type transport systems, permease components